MATVDRNNSSLTELVNTKNQLLDEAQTNYNNAIQGSEQKYNELIQASKDYGTQQTELQQARTDQNIAEINQEKGKTQRDYLKEQKGAYTDYANQTNEYGTNAERMAAQGLIGSGYQETSKVAMYNAYQNRIAQARQSYNDAVVQYDNQIAQAKLANSSALAEIAYNSLQNQLKLSLEGLQYKNQLLQDLTNTKLNINSTYNNMWQSMYNTLLQESQFNEQMDLQRQQLALQKQQLAQSRKSSGGSSSSKKSSGEELVVNDDGGSNANKEITSNNVKLSSQAQAVLAMNRKALAMGNANVARGAVADAVSRGQITENEATVICDKLGI